MAKTSTPKIKTLRRRTERQKPASGPAECTLLFLRAFARSYQALTTTAIQAPAEVILN